MGVVYEAEQESLGRHVALKVLLGSAVLNEKAVARFRREARSAARLHHSNIVPVFGFGEADGLHYYVMQFIHGRGLDEVIAELRHIGQSAPPPVDAAPPPRSGVPAGFQRSTVSAAEVARALATGNFQPSQEAADDSELSGDCTGPRNGTEAGTGPAPLTSPPNIGPTGSLDRSAAASLAPMSPKRPGLSDLSGSVAAARPYWREVARVGVQVARALEYAHAQGILHRDVKPSNLLLDLQGTVWVTDFGLAKAAADADLTHTGDIVGTLRYMAPERFNGQADARSDIYALGLTLYELLTLRPAFHATDRNRLIQQVTEGEPPRPRTLRPELPRDLETICLKCVAKEPGKRYGTAEDLARDLENWLEGLPITARPVPLWERASKWVRRKPAQAALAAVSILALVSLLAGGTWFTIHLSQALDVARRERYASDMNLAHLSWRDQNIPRVLELLDRYRGGDAEKFRSFESSYLASLCDPHPRTTVRSTSGSKFTYVAYSPDGQHLAAGETDGTVRIWDPERGVPIRTFTGHAGTIAGVLYSPEGGMLATWSADQTVRLWDAASGRERLNLPRFKALSGVSFSSDGQRLAISSLGGGVEIRSTASGQVLPTIPGAKGLGGSVAYSPDGRWLAIVPMISGDAKVMLWDAGNELWTIPIESGLGSAGHNVAFSPDGRFLSVLEGKFVSVWNPETGKPLRRLELDRPERSAKEAAAISHIPTGALVGGGNYNSNDWGKLEFSRDGQRLAVESYGKVSRVWDTETWEITFTVPGGASGGLGFHPDGRHLASARGNEILIWDEVTRREQPILTGHSGIVSAVTFSPDGRRLASASYEHSVKLWDAGTGRLERTLQGHRYNVYCVAFDPTGQWLATGSEDQDIRLWDVATGESTATFEGHTGPIYGVAFSPDGRLLASAGGDETVRLWNAQTGEKVCELPGQVGPVYGVAFSPDGRLLATAGLDKTVRLWDPATGAVRGVLTGHVDFVHSVAFSPDGRRLASASEDQTVRVWEIPSGRSFATLTGHTGPVYGVVFSLDGRRVISAGGDKLIKVWDPEIGQETLTLRNHEDSVPAVALDPKGRRLASASRDKTIRLWDATTKP